MPGPTPKDPSVRARRNKTATAAKLRVVTDEEAAEFVSPELPDRYELDEETGEFKSVSWHPRTLSWWETVWASPMRSEFLDADVEGLFLLAELEDDFHRATGPRARIDLAKEIRLQRQCFGLTPIDRRRLQWEIERTEEAEDKGSKRRGAKPHAVPPPAAPASGDDWGALR